MNMGERIKQMRLANNMTQEELGALLGVKKPTIMKYEKGIVKNMKRDKIQILSKIFNVSPSYILGYTDKKNNLNNNEKELVKLYNQMNVKQQVALLSYAYKILDEEKEK